MTITVATLLFAPAYWAMMIGVIALAADETDISGTAAAGLVAFGLAVIPFVFMVLAFSSGHPSAPGAVVRAMLVSVTVGSILSAIAIDVVTGIVGGVGAGAAVALRADPAHDWRHRAIGVAVAAAYAFFLARTASVAVVVGGPIFPITAVGLADHWSERRHARVAEPPAEA